MMKASVTPKDNMLHLQIPDNYVGKELEILLYAKDEVEGGKTPKGNAARFKGVLTKAEAEKYHAHLKQVRGQWERDI